jgi:hypothetical protein
MVKFEIRVVVKFEIRVATKKAPERILPGAFGLNYKNNAN